MARKGEQDRQSRSGPPSPAAGVLFLVGGFGFFYSLITIVDPLL